MENIMVIIAFIMLLVVGGWTIYELDIYNKKQKENLNNFHQLREDITMGRIGKKEITNLQLYKARKELSSERSKNLMRNRK